MLRAAVAWLEGGDEAVDRQPLCWQQHGKQGCAKIDRISDVLFKALYPDMILLSSEADNYKLAKISTSCRENSSTA